MTDVTASQDCNPQVNPTTRTEFGRTRNTTSDGAKKKSEKKKSKTLRLTQMIGETECLAYSTASHSAGRRLPLDPGQLYDFLSSQPGVITLNAPCGLNTDDYYAAINYSPGYFSPPHTDILQRQMPPAQSSGIDEFGTSIMPYSMASTSSRRAVKPRAKLFLNTADLELSLFGFGGDQNNGDPWCIVISDFKALGAFICHQKLHKPLLIEPLISDIPFRIEDTIGAGKGLFATRSIAKGEVFFREPPLIVYPCSHPLVLVLHFDRFIDYLPPASAVAFDSLENCHKRLRGSLVSRRHCIARTNELFLDHPHSLPSGYAYCGVFQTASRINHSCVPNVEFRFDWAGFQGTVQATRRIRAGEQITLSYIDTKMLKDERRAELKRSYLFHCTCDRCGPR